MDKKFIWKAMEAGSHKKSSNWYWVIGILAVGGATASIIAANALFGVLLLIGGFAIMLAGSRPRVERTFAMSDVGIHIDAHIIPWEKIHRFALNEDTPSVTLETGTLLGTLTIPLTEVDFREVRMELKNRNIDEEESLGTFVESISALLGL